MVWIHGLGKCFLTIATADLKFRDLIAFFSRLLFPETSFPLSLDEDGSFYPHPVMSLIILILRFHLKTNIGVVALGSPPPQFRVKGCDL